MIGLVSATGSSRTREGPRRGRSVYFVTKGHVLDPEAIPEGRQVAEVDVLGPLHEHLERRIVGAPAHQDGGVLGDLQGLLGLGLALVARQALAALGRDALLGRAADAQEPAGAALETLEDRGAVRLDRLAVVALDGLAGANLRPVDLLVHRWVLHVELCFTTLYRECRTTMC
jgi:hypothetical protein